MTLTLADRLTAFLDSAALDFEWPNEPQRVPANQQVRLGALRRSTVDSAIARKGATYKVVVYALVPADEDPAAALTLAEAYAHERGWHVVAQLTDDCGHVHPWAREGWRQVLKTLRGGFGQGVVTVGRAAVSPVDEPYEQTLNWLLDHFSFVEHVPPSMRSLVCA